MVSRFSVSNIFCILSYWVLLICTASLTNFHSCLCYELFLLSLFLLRLLSHSKLKGRLWDHICFVTHRESKIMMNFSLCVLSSKFLCQPSLCNVHVWAGFLFWSANLVINIVIEIVQCRVFKFSRCPVQVTGYLKHLRCVLFVFHKAAVIGDEIVLRLLYNFLLLLFFNKWKPCQWMRSCLHDLFPPMFCIILSEKGQKYSETLPYILFI